MAIPKELGIAQYRISSYLALLDPIESWFVGLSLEWPSFDALKKLLQDTAFYKADLPVSAKSEGRDIDLVALSKPIQNLPKNRFWQTVNELENLCRTSNSTIVIMGTKGVGKTSTVMAAAEKIYMLYHEAQEEVFPGFYSFIGAAKEFRRELTN